MKRQDMSGLINSSYTVFFVGFVFYWAHVFSGYFPEGYTFRAFVLASLFALMLHAFRFLLLQFYDGVTVLRLIVLYFSLSAFISFASAVKGPIAAGQIPAIQIIFFNNYISSAANPSFIVASIFPFYGMVTMICSILSAAALEYFYTRLFPFVPRVVRTGLLRADAHIDRTSLNATYAHFMENETKGFIAALLLLLGYGLMYSLLLIF